MLIYETFAAGHEAIGKPSNPDFLLRPGELVAAVQGHAVQGHSRRLRIVAFEEGFEPEPRRVVQRIVAVHETAGSVPVARRLPTAPGA